MVNRISILLLKILALLAVFLFINPGKTVEPPDPKYKIGILAASDAKIKKIEGFKRGMTDLGFVEDNNISYIVFNAQGQRENLSFLSGKLARMKLDVLIATGGVEADDLKTATADLKTPVVFIGSASSVERGLIKSFLQPGIHITGVDNYHAELAGKRLELLKKLLPSIRRVAVVYDPQVPPGYQSLRIVREMANILGIEIGTIEISSKEEMTQKLRPDKLQGFDALLPFSSFFIEAITHDLLVISLENRIPVMGIYGQDSDNGFFASYGVSMEDQGYQGARLVAKVLDGQKPENIPVETPDNLDLIINLRTARILGLELSQNGLSLARVVVK